MTAFPLHCPGCNALRLGIQEGQAIYACRSTMRLRDGKSVLTRTPACVESGKEPGK